MTCPTERAGRWVNLDLTAKACSLLPSTVRTNEIPGGLTPQALEGRYWKTKHQRGWRQDFSVVPVVKTSPSKAGGVGSILGGVGGPRAYMPEAKNKQNIKQKQYTVTNSTKTAKKKSLKKKRGWKGPQSSNQFIFWKNLRGSSWTRTLVCHLNCNTLHLAVIPWLMTLCMEWYAEAEWAANTNLVKLRE